MYEKSLEKKSPAYDMASNIFDQFSDIEQVEIVKELIKILVEKRNERYESLMDEARRIDARAKDIAVGSQHLIP